MFGVFMTDMEGLESNTYIQPSDSVNNTFNRLIQWQYPQFCMLSIRLIL